MHESHDASGVPDSILLDSINTWPPGTVGYREEADVIVLLNSLCKKHGYGFIPQMTKMIEDIWREPKKAEEYAKIMRDRWEQIQSTRQSLKNG